MVTVLLIVTLVSLIMTIALSVLVVRLMREDRQRSNARAAALAQMADAEAQQFETTEEPEVTFVPRRPSAAAAPPLPEPQATFVPRRAPIAPPPIAAPPLAEPAFHPARATAFELGDMDLGEADADGTVRPVAAHDLFTVERARSPWPGRLGVAAVIATLILTIGFVLRSRVGTDKSPAVTAASQPAGGMLELMSLKHAQESNTLTITGLVQNPPEGVELSKVVATAFLFGADGSFLASGRAPLDSSILRPGDQSGFVINVPVTTSVARYRVGFRGDDGRVIGHVDRRPATAMALSGTAKPVSARRIAFGGAS